MHKIGILKKEHVIRGVHEIGSPYINHPIREPKRHQSARTLFQFRHLGGPEEVVANNCHVQRTLLRNLPQRSSSPRAYRGDSIGGGMEDTPHLVHPVSETSPYTAITKTRLETLHRMAHRHEGL